MSLIPIGVTTVNGRSQSLNAARLINLFPEITGPDSRSELILRSTPGLSTFSTVGTGPIRGMHEMNISNASTLFVVSGTDLYEIDSDGAETLRGSAGTIAGTGFVGMASNANDELVVINSSGTGWVWDDSTLATIASGDADFGDDASSVAFLDQFLVFSRADTGQAFASDSNNAKSYDASSFATAEASPDNLVQVYALGSIIWAFGGKTTELWYNAGTSPWPFARIGGAVFNDIGGVANTVADVDQAIYWHAPNGSVYRAADLLPVSISTHEIEFTIRDWTNHYAFAYRDEGHSFYVLGADEGCVVYDAANGLWHERESFTVERWRANNYARAYSKHLVGDYLIGTVYEMSLDNYADGSNALQRRVITPPLHMNGVKVSMSEIQIHFEAGIGLTSGQGSDPQVMLDWSDDGGKTYSNEKWRSIGKIGEYRKRTIWRQLGAFRKRNFRFTYTEPTKYTIYGGRIGQNAGNPAPA